MVIPAQQRGGGSSVRSPIVVALDHDMATQVAVVGAKAANLAAAAAASLPVLPGFAVPVDAVTAALGAGGFANLPAESLADLREAWTWLTADGSSTVVVRSSAVSEDAEGSSMAGRFRSVLDVQGWPAFAGALDAVASSADVCSLDGTGAVERHEMAIVVQRFLRATSGGVLFGADPVTGRCDRFALATVRGGPDALVSGVEGGAEQLLSRRGRILRTDGDRRAASSRRLARRLAFLARRAADVFGAPQDIEWAVDDVGRLWLLQSRPITTLPSGVACGRVFGPGPVAETFPDPLRRLEQDLWLAPLRAGIVQAIDLTGVVARREIRESPVVVAIGGRAAVDLHVIGAFRRRSSTVAKLDPRPGARRLRAAWRTGRLRRAFADIAGQVIETVDRELAAVPALGSLDGDALLDLVAATRRLLVALHGQEVLAGVLVGSSSSRSASATRTALEALAHERAAATAECRIAALHPEVLSLVPPAIRPVTLPPPPVEGSTSPAAPQAAGDGDGRSIGELRDALRLRARWVQELSALAAWELGERLAARGALASPASVAHLDLGQLEAAVAGRPIELAPPEPDAPPLPPQFTLDAFGHAVALRSVAQRAGQGAGGGRGEGYVVHDPSAVVPGSSTVLVTRTLDPSLAAALPGLAGLVSESGSVLSHLAILARELGVATVVDVPRALDRYPSGTMVIVDGATGAIEEVSP